MNSKMNKKNLKLSEFSWLSNSYNNKPGEVMNFYEPKTLNELSDLCMYFYNKGSEDIYISSADWMTRNLDYRIEAAIKVTDKSLKKELKDILEIQLSDNVKARILDKNLRNEYVKQDKKHEIRSQIETYKYSKSKTKEQ